MRLLCIGVAALVLGLGTAVVLGEASAHRPPPAVLASSTARPTAEGVAPARLVGRWRRDSDGIGLIVTAKGDVWSDSGAMQGRALPGRSGADFAFGARGFFCAYALTFKPGAAADWRLVDRTPGTPCPAGVFTRATAL